MQISFSSFVHKEMLHILRDPRTMLVVLVIPVVLILLFGFTVSTDVQGVGVVAVAPVRCYEVADRVGRIAASPSFRFKGYVSPQEMDRVLRSGEAAAAVVFPMDFARSGSCQIVLDGADVNTAATVRAYLQGVLTEDAAQNTLFATRMLFNPQMKSAYNFVPGILGMILLLVCAMMTSISIVREKESGTMEVLLVSPVRPVAIILSKMVPYLLLGCADLALILLLARFVLGIPLSGGVAGIVAVSVLYILLALSLGMLVSSLAGSQITALLICAMVMLMPVVFFSGLLFPPENMPWALRWITYVVPARWYIDAMRKMMIEGLPLRGVLLETGVLLAETLVLMAAATKKFNDRLE